MRICAQEGWVSPASAAAPFTSSPARHVPQHSRTLELCAPILSPKNALFRRDALKLGTKASPHTLLRHLQLELGEVSSTNPEEGGFVSVTSSCASEMAFFEALCLFAWLFTFHCQYFGWNQGLMS